MNRVAIRNHIIEGDITTTGRTSNSFSNRSDLQTVTNFFTITSKKWQREGMKVATKVGYRVELILILREDLLVMEDTTTGGSQLENQTTYQQFGSYGPMRGGNPPSGHPFTFSHRNFNMQNQNDYKNMGIMNPYAYFKKYRNKR